MKLTLGKLIGGVVAIWLLAPLILWFWPNDLTKSGQVGDLFGSVNALFSGLAFAGLLWALYLQREQLVAQQDQLVLQREELKLQREEMAASRAELANQVRAQRDLARATAAQVTVAAHQAHIEGIKLQFTMGLRPTEQNQLLDQIIMRGNTIGELAADLHELVTGEVPSDRG